MLSKPPKHQPRKSTRQYRYTPGGRFRALPVRAFLAALCVAGFLFCGVYLYRYIARSAQTRQTNEAVAALYHAGEALDTPEPARTLRPGVTGVPFITMTPQPQDVFQRIASEPLNKFKDLLKANPDLIGWLNIQGELDLPVCYRDNDYYLTRDVYGKKNPSGTLFLDENHPLTASAQHLLIHGHNMKDGSMFGRLHHYLELDYLRKHCILNFDTLYAQSKYMIFAVVIVPENVHGAGYINYQNYPVFHTQKEFTDFVDGLKARSSISIPVKVDATDALLTLSTCHGDDRLLVAARRLRPDEAVSNLTQLVSYAFEQ